MFNLKEMKDWKFADFKIKINLNEKSISVYKLPGNQYQVHQIVFKSQTFYCQIFAS